ncbi:MAG: hypothetical protein ILP18_09055 [Treponema sp.]|nr:hypothetical protein [Treponema sp.]
MCNPDWGGVTSCDYWDSEWYKEGNSSTGSGGSSGSGSSVSDGDSEGSLALIVLGCSDGGTVVDMTTIERNLPKYEGKTDVEIGIQNGVSPSELVTIAGYLKTFNTDFAVSFEAVDSRGLIRSIPAGCFTGCAHLKEVRYNSDAPITITSGNGSLPAGTVIAVYDKSSRTWDRSRIYN